MTETENTISTGKERNSADRCRISSNSVKPAEAGGEGEKESSSSSSVNSSSSSKKQGKSCNGCLYYSSTDKSNSQSPLCLGLSRSLPQVPQYIVGESEMEASKDDRNLTDFRYACIGYSVYLDQKARSADGQEVQTELPVSVGLEVLVDRKVLDVQVMEYRSLDHINQLTNWGCVSHQVHQERKFGCNRGCQELGESGKPNKRRH